MSNAANTSHPPDEKMITTFVSSGRTGRRNALGDILIEGERSANTSGLPQDLATMNITDSKDTKSRSLANSGSSADKS